MLDIRTLLTLLAATSVLMLVLAVSGIDRAARTRGLNMWAWMLGVNCVSMILLGLRSELPYAIYLLGPALTHAAPVLQKRALDLALRQTDNPSTRRWAVLAAVFASTTVALPLAGVSPDARGVVYAAFFVVIYGVMTVSALRSWRRRQIPSLLWLGITFGAYAMVFAYRGGVALGGGLAGSTTLSPTVFNIVTLVSVLFVLITSTVAFLMLEMSLLQRSLRDAALRDGLTGLLNRRGMEERLDAAHALHRRAGQSYALTVIDIDHFKAINDRHGHDCGDRVLADVAGVLQAALRGSDAIARFGGEEFVALLPELDGEAATVVAERLRAAVASRRAPVDGDPAFVHATVSIGVAICNGEENWAAVFARADAAMYAAKAAGRNRVRFGPAAAAVARPVTHGLEMTPTV